MIFFFILLSLLPLNFPLYACDDYYLEWRKLPSTQIATATSGCLAISDALMYLKQDLYASKLLKWKGNRKIVLAFTGWGEQENIANNEQRNDIIAALEEVLPVKRTQIDIEKFVDAPDYDKLSSIIKKSPTDYSISIIVKDYNYHWKTFITRDYSSIFKIRYLLKETATVECKVVNSDGELIFMKSYKPSPSQIFDITFENSGLNIMTSSRVSGKPVINVIADDLK